MPKGAVVDKVQRCTEWQQLGQSAVSPVNNPRFTHGVAALSVLSIMYGIVQRCTPSSLPLNHGVYGASNPRFGSVWPKGTKRCTASFVQRVYGRDSVRSVYGRVYGGTVSVYGRCTASLCGVGVCSVQCTPAWCPG